MPWWGWVVVGVVLLGTELLVPADFWLVFIGVAAIGVGVATGAVPGLSVTAQWALFGLFAAVSLVFFRRLVRTRFVERPADGRVDDALVGEAGRALEPLAPGALGRIELRGSTWTARNGGPDPIAADARVRVERVEGLTLHVRREA